MAAPAIEIPRPGPLGAGSTAYDPEHVGTHYRAGWLGPRRASAELYDPRSGTE